MESSSSHPPPSTLEYLSMFIFRPVVAVLFVVLFLSLGWFLAWKLVLVHVPLVQEICGMRKKPAKPKPQIGRLSKYYNYINNRNSSGS